MTPAELLAYAAAHPEKVNTRRLRLALRLIRAFAPKETLVNDPASTDLGPSPTDDDVDPTGPPVWSPAEHSRIRFRLLAEFDATVEYLNRLLTADLTTADVADDIREALFTGRRKTARLTSLILDEFRWLVEHETADGHADPHDFCGDLATLTPAPVAEPVKPLTPLLGLASTETLLREIATRMEITQNSDKGRDLGRLCCEAIDNLDRGVLDYRTVDHR